MTTGKAVGAAENALVVDAVITDGSANPITSNAVFDALATRPVTLGTPVLGQVAVVTQVTPLQLTYATPAAGGASNLAVSGTDPTALSITNSNGTGATLGAPTATRGGVLTNTQAGLIATAVQVTGTPAVGQSIRVTSLAPTVHSYQSDPANTVSAVAAPSVAIDYATNGTYQTRTVVGGASFTFTGWPAAPIVAAMVLEITHTSGAITFPAAVVWPNNVAPVLTTGRVHMLTFVTRNGGTTIRGGHNPNYTS